MEPSILKENPLEKLKIDYFYSISKSFKIKKQESFNEKIKCKCWCFQVDTGRKHNTRFNNSWPIYEYQFFDLKLNPIYFTYKGWGIYYLKDPEVNTFYALGEILIFDPKRNVRLLEANGGGSQTIYDAVAFIKNVSLYPNWEIFDIVNERQYLIDKIKMLETSKKFKSIVEQFIKLNHNWNDIHQLEGKLYNHGFYEKWIREETKNYRIPNSYPEYYQL